MIKVRRANERGHAEISWLKSFHTFSFSEYYDPAHMGFRSLRVINEDFIAGGGGFPTHPHRDMEIITYVIEGELQHRDSMGNGTVIKPGDVQRMTAGTGVRHSEFNASQTVPCHLLQIWILPEAQGLTPGYEQKMFAENEKKNKLRLVASRDGAEGSVVVHQDMKLYASILEAGKTLTTELTPGRGAWVQIVSGKVTCNGETLSAGDAVSINDEKLITLSAGEGAEFLLFDLA